MIERKTFDQKVIEFNKKLSKISMELPDGFKIINPFNGSQKEIVTEIGNKVVVKGKKSLVIYFSRADENYAIFSFLKIF